MCVTRAEVDIGAELIWRWIQVLDDNQTQNCNKLRVIGHLRLEGSITPDLNAKPVKGGDDDSDEASSVAKTRSERVRPQSPASPSGSFRKSFKNRTRRFKDMFKSDSEGE